MMASQGIGFWWDEAKFKNVENLLKLTVDWLCEKFLKFHEQK